MTLVNRIILAVKVLVKGDSVDNIMKDFKTKADKLKNLVNTKEQELSNLEDRANLEADRVQTDFTKAREQYEIRKALIAKKAIKKEEANRKLRRETKNEIIKAKRTADKLNELI